jgi:hypothetical protein
MRPPQNNGEPYPNLWRVLVVVFLMLLAYAFGCIHGTRNAEIRMVPENLAQVCAVHQPCRIYIQIDPNLSPGSFENVKFEEVGDPDMR